LTDRSPSCNNKLKKEEMDMKHKVIMSNPSNGKKKELVFRATTVEELYLIIHGLEDLGLTIEYVEGDLA